MTRRWTLPIVLLLASAATPADSKLPSGFRIERAPEFVQRVNEAIDRGVEWLKKTEAADGSYPEFGNPGATTAMAYHTMRVCGVPRDDPSAKRAWDALRRGYKKEDLKTYSAALYLMAIAEHGDRVGKAQDDYEVKLSAEDRKWASEIVRLLAGGQNDDGAWSYDVEDAPTTGSGAAGAKGARGASGTPYDHSNTQYALLGLKSAARCRIPIDASVWRKSLAHFLATQEATGPDVPRLVGGGKKGATGAAVVDHARGWGYVGAVAVPSGRVSQVNATCSMTAAGVSSVVICRSELMGTHDMPAKLESESEKSVWDGLAFLGTTWRGSRRGQRMLNLYEFYGVERAGILAGVEWMADLDWYGAGAPIVLDAQTQDGGWTGMYGGRVARGAAGRMALVQTGDVVDTCFALLFLKKGTTPVRRGAVTQAFDDTDINFGEATKLSGPDFEDFIDLVLSHWRRSTADDAKARLFDRTTSVGPRIVEPLLVRLDARDVETRAAAHALLKHATGVDFGYVASGPSEERESALSKWMGWWLGAKDKVSYDPTAKRLVVQ